MATRRHRLEKKRAGSEGLLTLHPWAPHLTTVWLTAGLLWYPAPWAAVFGLVANLNFPVAMVLHRDATVGRDLLYEQWDRLFAAYVGVAGKHLPSGWGADVLVLAIHVVFHIIPAAIFYQVSTPWRARDVLIACAYIPVWCSVCTGAIMRGRVVALCNASELYVTRSDKFWGDAFKTAYAMFGLILLWTLAMGRY